MLKRVIAPDTELKILHPRHAEEMFAVVDRNRAYLRRWLPWVDSIQSVQDSRIARRRGLDRYETNRSFDAGIWVQGTLAGVIGLHLIDWSNRKTAIGYWLTEEFQGRGLMTIACRALLDHAFDDLKLNRIEISAATENLRSRAIPERLGFHHEATLRQSEWLYDHFVDQELYSMLAQEWGKLQGVQRAL